MVDNTENIGLDDGDDDDAAHPAPATENTAPYATVETAPFNFLDLPPELRNTINHLILISPEPVLHHSKLKRHEIRPYTIVQDPTMKKTTYKYPFPAGAVNHLLASKDVYAETISIFYGSNRFLFGSVAPFKTFLGSSWPLDTRDRSET